MTSIVDAMGLTLPGASSIPAVDSGHSRMASACGARIVEMVWEDLRPSRIVTATAFVNGIVAYGASAARPMRPIHLIAMAGRAGVDLTLDDMAELRRRGSGLRQPVSLGHLSDGGLLFRRRAAGAALNRLADHLALDRPDRQRPHARREHRRRRMLGRRRHPTLGQSGRAALATAARSCFSRAISRPTGRS